MLGQASQIGWRVEGSFVHASWRRSLGEGQLEKVQDEGSTGEGLSTKTGRGRSPNEGPRQRSWMKVPEKTSGGRSPGEG